MPKKNKNKSDGLEIALNSAIAISGVILLGFLYSFSQNQLHDGIEIEPTVNYSSSQPILAKDIYIQNPVEDIKVEVLNGCGVSALALKTTESNAFIQNSIGRCHEKVGNNIVAEEFYFKSVEL